VTHAETDTGSFLLEQFREFYRELVHLKQRVSRESSIYVEGQKDAAEEEWSPSAVWQRLLSVLERQALVSRRKGGEFGEQFYREAQYVMAALADDVFLHLSWSGKESWNSNLLETKLFRSHHAGEAIFKRLDQVLAGRDPLHVDLAKLYLLSLGLGFQGKFRGLPDGPRQLAAYKQEILEFISERDAKFRASSTRIFPEAYASTIDQGPARKLPYLEKWLLAYPVVIAIWILAGWMTWSQVTSELDPIIDRIVPGSERTAGTR
jgi:type VI secretion system protein ImpK